MQVNNGDLGYSKQPCLIALEAREVESVTKDRDGEKDRERKRDKGRRGGYTRR